MYNLQNVPDYRFKFLDCVGIHVDGKTATITADMWMVKHLENAWCCLIGSPTWPPSKKAAVRIRQDLTDALFLTLKVDQSNKRLCRPASQDERKSLSVVLCSSFNKETLSSSDQIGRTVASIAYVLAAGFRNLIGLFAF